MKIRIFPILLLAVVFWLAGSAVAAPAPGPLPLDRPHAGPIGLAVTFLQETDGALTLDQAVSAYASGAFKTINRTVPDFGIGAKPVWLHFSVSNAGNGPLPQWLSIENPWLDDVDVYFRRGDQTLASYRVGDREPFAQRPVQSRYLVIDHAFGPGVEDVFMRVATPDPMVVPIYLMAPAEARLRNKFLDYSYGFLYGFVFALMAYNTILFAGLRQTKYLLYSLYLGAFLLMNLSYSGHGFEWFWPEHTSWAQWSNPILMVLYGTSGLVFALSFLDLRSHLPRVHKAVVGFIGVTCLLEGLSVLVGSQRDALLVAFSYVFLFSLIMPLIGILSLRSGRTPARYFLLAAISAMVGAALTALAVWGFIPYTPWTFRAIDIGVLIDATLLALALTYQFRTSQQERQQAVELAKLDPLTGVNNRRAFYELSAPIWNVALRNDRDLSVVMLDVDHFKRINDLHGHAVGDSVLTAVADVLTRSIRDQDIIARWGGEEFIILLPETDLAEAVALAERLRGSIAGSRWRFKNLELSVTASLGVAQRQPDLHKLDTLISMADDQLYDAKASGRNRVSAPGAAAVASATARS